MDTGRIDTVIQACGSDNSALVAILQEVQKQEGYLPRKALARLSQRLEVPLSRLYALATFYRSFSLSPTGRHKISVCFGTACHVRGAEGILSRIEQLLGVETGQTTLDRQFTLDTVRCVGCCSLGPVVRIDEETFGRVKRDGLEGILKRFR